MACVRAGCPAAGAKTKALVNAGISVSAQSEWCIAFHAKAAPLSGAIKDEIMALGFMAVPMHGGPASTYMMRLAEALDEFAEQQS